MSLVRPTVGALIAGVLGATAWALVAYFGNMEIGWIAWGIGALVGLGARVASGGELDMTTGVLCAVIAILSVAGGKFAVVSIIVDDMVAEVQSDEMTEELLISYVADEVVAKFEEDGRPVAWPSPEAEMGPAAEADYPADVWTEALERWEAMEPEARAAYGEERARERDEMMQAIAGEMRKEGFLASFGALDILFLGLAIITAFKIGSGASAASET